MYSVIEFQNEDGQRPEVEVVPFIWLKREEQIWYCYWPIVLSKKEIRKAIEKRYSPKNNWAKYNCTVLHTCGKFIALYKKFIKIKVERHLILHFFFVNIIISASYYEARKKLVYAEFTSTLETDVEQDESHRPKRKLKRPYRFVSDSSNSEEEVSNLMPPLPKIKTPTKQSTFTSKTTTLCKSSISTATTDSKHSPAINLEESASPGSVFMKRSSRRTINSSPTTYSSRSERPRTSICPPCSSPCSFSRHSEKSSPKDLFPRRSPSISIHERPSSAIGSPCLFPRPSAQF